jgi:hypothetical protein
MKARAIALFAFVASLAASTDAHAYCRSTTCAGSCARDGAGCKTQGLPLYWASSCVGFSLQEDGSEHIAFADFAEVAILSFLAWSELDCGGGLSSIAFTRLADVECHRAEYDPSGPNANVVMFQDYKWDYQGTDNTLAKTTVTYDSSTGEILDADIELNHAFNELTIGDDQVVYDLQSILTHEIGHFIGLDHTLDPVATMNAGYSPGDTDPRELALDDVAAACAVYPPDRPATCKPEPRGGFTDECSGAGDDADEGACAVAPAVGARPLDRLGFWLPIALALLAARRRARSR